MTEFEAAAKVNVGDTIRVARGKTWSKPLTVDQVIKMADIWETDKLHGVCMRFTNGQVASFRDDGHPVKVINA